LTLTFAETGRIDTLSSGLCKSSDLDSVHERLAPYVAAGFRALCARANSAEPALPQSARAAISAKSAKRR
jgi:Tetracyclin repressor-like, C-terminal domain